MQGTMPGARRQGRPCTAWMDSISSPRGRVIQNDRRQVNGESTSMAGTRSPHFL